MESHEDAASNYHNGGSLNNIDTISDITSLEKNPLHSSNTPVSPAAAAAAAHTPSDTMSDITGIPSAMMMQSSAEQHRANMSVEEYAASLRDPYSSSPNSIYDRYDIPVDHEEGDRGMKIKLCSFQRPHMRALHCAWMSFFLAFCIWFAPAPLLKEIQDTLKLTKAQVWMSSITNDLTAIFIRTIIGPICDAYGARIPMAVVLCAAAIPTACLGLVQSGPGLSAIRFFIGIAGSSFVMAQYWPSRMFAREIAGTANGIVGGWGNLGGAFTQVLMGRILFPVFRDYVYNGNRERAWRTISVIPAAIAFCFGCIVACISDDAPMGNYSEMRKRGTMDRVYFTTALRSGARLNTWILYIQYACCFGVELVMNNAAVLYYNHKFGLSTEQGAVLGFIFGSLNIFARGLGGFFSDWLNLKYGMRGRLWLTTILLALEGVIILIFAFADTLAGAIATMCVFSVFTQAAEGAIYGVVPYVSKLYTGSVSGLVGAGGNLGSVIFGFGFRSLSYQHGFIMMGSIAVASSFLSLFVKIPLHAGLIFGQDNHTVIQARERFRLRVERERAMRLAQETPQQVETTPTTEEPTTPQQQDAPAAPTEKVEIEFAEQQESAEAEQQQSAEEIEMVNNNGTGSVVEQPSVEGGVDGSKAAPPSQDTMV